MNIRLLMDNYINIAEVTKKHNEFFPEDKKTYDDLITACIENALEKADWTKLHRFNYYYSKDGSKIWQKFDYRIPEDLKEKIKKLLEYNRGVFSEDDIVNFSIRYWMPALKKNIIDSTWNEENLIELLTAIGIIEGEQDLNYLHWVPQSLFATDCPMCGHEDRDAAVWAIYKIPFGLCHACGQKFNIWQVLDENFKKLGGLSPVEFVWKLLIEGKDLKRCKVIDFEKKRQEAEEIREKRKEEGIEQAKAILKDCTRDFSYLNKYGFDDEVLIECGVYYRDLTVTDNYFSNSFRGRIIYEIRDFSGELAGVKGRWAMEKEEWEKLLLNDVWYLKHSKYLDKVHEKSINTKGCYTGEHLYLLHKYYGKSSEYEKVVIVEGEKDAIRVYAQKIKGVAVVGSFGCNITEKQIRNIVSGLGWNKEIILCYDNDQRGFEGNLKAYKKFKDLQFSKVSFCLYPEGYKDFGDMCTKEEQEMIKTILENTLSFEEYVEVMGKRGYTIDESKIKIA